MANVVSAAIVAAAATIAVVVVFVHNQTRASMMQRIRIVPLLPFALHHEIDGCKYSIWPSIFTSTLRAFPVSICSQVSVFVSVAISATVSNSIQLERLQSNIKR